MCFQERGDFYEAVSCGEVGYCDRSLPGRASGAPSVGPSVEERGPEGVKERDRGHFSIARICLPFSGKFCVVATSSRLVPRVINPGSVFRHFDDS